MNESSTSTPEEREAIDAMAHALRGCPDAESFASALVTAFLREAAALEREAAAAPQ